MTGHPRPARRLAAVAVVVAAAAAGCGGTHYVIGPPTSAPRPGAAYEVTTGQVPGVGRVLVDGAGDTLYLFVPDAHSSHSRCVGACASAWPPVLVPNGVAAPRAGRGVAPARLGVTTRADGTRQATYGGWPLYRFANDQAPGQDTGQGLDNLGGLWYVVSPDGDPVR